MTLIEGTTRMHSSRRKASAIVAAGLAAGLVAALAVPAGARVAEKNDKFCKILYSDQGAGIDFEGLGPAEAEYAATLMRKLAKAGVPAKLKKDLKKVAKIYDRIADGASEGDLADDQDFILEALTRISKYSAKNCTPAVPTS